MFSRRHPFLFFILTFSGIGAAFFAVMALIIAVVMQQGFGGADRIPGEKVGVVEITGVISDAKDILSGIKRFREDDAVKAIVVRINTPGGAVGPSQEIYREIRKTLAIKKPVIASLGSIAASGGYYVASAASGIMANPGTITGSIGVIMGYTNFQKILEKIGLVPVVIKSGEFKDMGSPVRQMKTGEKKLFQELVDAIHHQFIQDVAQGRDMEIEKVKELADGRIFTGAQALKYEFVDRLGNLEDAVEWAGRTAGIKGKISAVYAKKKEFSFFKYLSSSSSVNEMLKQIIQPDLHADFVYSPE